MPTEIWKVTGTEFGLGNAMSAVRAEYCTVDELTGAEILKIVHAARERAGRVWAETTAADIDDYLARKEGGK